MGFDPNKVVPLDLSRQAMLVSDGRKGMRILLIGAGAIGSTTAFCLAKMGFEDITIYDGDTLGEENAAGGVFDIRMAGKTKVESVKSIVRIASGVTLPCVLADHYYGDEAYDSEYDIVILAVDSLEARRDIYNNFMAEGGTAHWWIDGRIGGHGFQVYTYNEYDKRLQTWVASLYAEEPSLPCGQKATAYVSLGCAAAIGASVVAITNGTSPFAMQIVEYDNRSSVYA